MSFNVSTSSSSCSLGSFSSALLQDEKNQVLITNAWLQLVGPPPPQHFTSALPVHCRVVYFWKRLSRCLWPVASVIHIFTLKWLESTRCAPSKNVQLLNKKAFLLSTMTLECLSRAVWHGETQPGDRTDDNAWMWLKSSWSGAFRSGMCARALGC